MNINHGGSGQPFPPLNKKDNGNNKSNQQDNNRQDTATAIRMEAQDDGE